MFKEELVLVPTKPGSYQMYDKNDIVIYVGKAKNLKRRLSSYFNRTQTGKTAELVKNIAYFKYIVTNTELESFILEINLIKKYNSKGIRIKVATKQVIITNSHTKSKMSHIIILLIL